MLFEAVYEIAAEDVGGTWAQGFRASDDEQSPVSFYSVKREGAENRFELAGWKKAVVYWLITVLLITLVAWGVGSYFGEYICQCMLNKAPGS